MKACEYVIIAGLILCTFGASVAQDKTTRSNLITLSDLEYKGAFRLPYNNFGASDMTYAEGQIAYNSNRHSLFVVGHKHQQAIAEFLVPELSTSTTISKLNMSPAPRQNFSRVINRAKNISPDQPIDTIGGLLHYKDRLIINAYEYYDGNGDNTLTTLVIDDANNIASSSVSGFYELQGQAHASGWMSPIPKRWQKSLGGKWITGSSSYMPIISRLSVGPSAFVFNPDDLGTIEPVPTVALLDFSLDQPLQKDLFNRTQNDLWNHLSRAVYGFIPPASDSYVTVGFSGGHKSGVCYKCIPTGSTTECPGYCAQHPGDYHLMYWLWDVNELLKVSQGKIQPHTVRPYEYGIMTTPFTATELGGGSFDPESGLLFLTLQSADKEQTRYGAPPLVAVYSLQ